jgi:RNA polymerase sigma factor (sigma-70 family)
MVLDPEPGGPDSPEPAGPTSLHVRRAKGGDRESCEWIVEKFSPFLLASARYRLGDRLRRLYDPEDLVQEVWAVALPKLAHLEPRAGRYTPPLLKFLAGTLLNKFGNLIQKHIRGKPRQREAGLGGAGEDAAEAVAELAAPLTDLLSRVVRKEREAAVVESLERLAPADREIIVLRGIEQHPYKGIAAALGVDEKLLPMRYRRALERLRKELPGSLYEEFIEE